MFRVRKLPYGRDKALGTQCNVMINVKTSVVDYYIEPNLSFDSYDNV